MSTSNHSVFLLANGGVEWPSTIVAVAIVVFLGVLMTIALMRYKMDEVLKLWAALGTIAGIVIGTFGTYFFTREKVETAQAQREAVSTDLRLAETQLNAFKTASDAVKTKLSPKDAEWFGQMIYKDTTTSYGATPEKTPKPKSKFQYQIYRSTETPT